MAKAKPAEAKMDDRVSLAGLSPEDALKALLATPPPEKTKRPKKAKG